jgi:hypothetical protein
VGKLGIKTEKFREVCRDIEQRKKREERDSNRESKVKEKVVEKVTKVAPIREKVTEDIE